MGDRSARAAPCSCAPPHFSFSVTMHMTLRYLSNVLFSVTTAPFITCRIVVSMINIIHDIYVVSNFKRLNVESKAALILCHSHVVMHINLLSYMHKKNIRKVMANQIVMSKVAE